MMGRYRGTAGGRSGGRYSIVGVIISSLVCFIVGFFLRGFHQLTSPSESSFSRPLTLQEQRAFTGTLHQGGADLDRESLETSNFELSQGNEELKKILEEIAINNEVIAAVSNHMLITPDGQYGMLKLWVDGLRQANVTNMLVIGLDDQVAEAMAKLGVPCWRTTPAAVADKSKSGHAVSALKFQLIRDFLVLGYSILLSDVDILTLKNPFDYLYRDRDIEALSDGFDSPTAYGYDDVFRDKNMGWAQFAHTFRIFSLNSGLFYTRPNRKNINLMDRITARLMKAKEWDQAVFNEEIFFPTHDDYEGTDITVRVMNMYDFLNSKTLFKTVRYESRFADHVPVMVHVNYHPNKFERLQDIWKRYVEHDMHALDHYPVGSCENDKCPED